MKKLYRGQAPLCLARFKHNRDDWSVIRNTSLYEEIWKELDSMQKGFCAYCECNISKNNAKGHIEHFIQRNKDRSLTFDWNNLFGSCSNPNRCGKYKDHNSTAKPIDLSKVCKPDEMDASELLLFLNDGNVRPRTNLSPEEAELANNTIAVFNLNGDSKLVNSRKIAIVAEKGFSDAYWEMLGQKDESLVILLEEELNKALERIKNSEYSTALKHLWTNNEKY